ncbi:MAG TPA: 50S ribosomal protein L5 [Candidatus Acetothermia bacterium]|jgi:large subunit ribosomal protein L5|nr:50S ribosomal protein L5 [Candidatus Bipolaricaulota bacterium]RLE41183.1 MAG: 50S ribosomal protein L5 [Candidatus Acetothermia bacterium]HDJ29498.1 50S ribosomal protein L5 [Candidatus Acetothermia bacterium]
MLLKERFEQEIIPQLMKELHLKNVMEVPRVEKVVVNMGIKEKDNPKVLEGAVKNLTKLAGQRPIVTKAKKSISDFRLTAGEPIGCKVTLRRDRAYEFLNKLFNVVLPGIRDFRGLSSSSFDGRGNYTLGVSEQLIFPEISYSEITTVQGMDITIVTTARNDQEGYALLKALGLPFKD